jgi:hypothetical protein
MHNDYVLNHIFGEWSQMQCSGIAGFASDAALGRFILHDQNLTGGFQSFSDGHNRHKLATFDSHANRWTHQFILEPINACSQFHC